MDSVAAALLLFSELDGAATAQTVADAAQQVFETIKKPKLRV